MCLLRGQGRGAITNGDIPHGDAQGRFRHWRLAHLNAAHYAKQGRTAAALPAGRAAGAHTRTLSPR